MQRILRWIRRRILPVSLLLPALVSLSQAADVPGRILLELTGPAARQLHAGNLDLPIPAGYQGPAAVVRPLFTARRGPLARIALLTFTPSGKLSNAQWLDALGGSAAVLRAEPDQVMAASALPDDPYLPGGNGLPRQAHLLNPGGLSVEAARAWPFVPAGASVPVAIIDTGVHWRHEDLGGDGPPGSGVIWRNDAEYFGAPEVDDDENGFVDDVIGWDFVDIPTVIDSVGGGLGSATPVAGEDANDADNDPSDFAGHGTRVAGVVTAMHNNGLGLAAGAPGARIMPLRVGWQSGAGPVVFMSFCAQALEYAAMNGARVANCSWDSQNLFGLGFALDLAIQELDLVVVGSAGNNRTTSTTFQYLASRADVLGVAGLNTDGSKASQSNYGNWVALSAFYGGILSTSYAGGSQVAGYATIPNGTSFAAPQVAAAAALVRMLDPSLAYAQVHDALQSTARDLSVLEPTFADRLGSGLVDFAGAARLVSQGWERAGVAEGLTPLPGPDGLPGGGMAWLSGDSLSARAGSSGLALPGWGAGFAAGDSIGTAPFAVRREDRVWVAWASGSMLHARAVDDPLVTRVWPVAGHAGQGIGVWDPALGADVLYVPHEDGVTRVRSTPPAAGGAPQADTVTELPWAWSVIAAGTVAGDLALVGLDEDERVDARRASGDVLFQVDAGPVSVGPIVGEFDGVGSGSVVIGGPGDAPGQQRVRFIASDGSIARTVSFDAPELLALSAAGQTAALRAVAVAVDASGGIHVITGDGDRGVIAAGGPVLGEVLSADVDGDYHADLVALRADGTLLAWSESLLPLAGFPRRIPAAGLSPPAVVDQGEKRRVVVADAAGSVWGIPVGRTDGPAPWPTAGGSPARQGYLGHDRAVPAEASALLQFEDGALCWTASGVGDLVRLRVVAGSRLLWEGPPTETGCIGISDLSGDLRLEGLTRRGNWLELGRLSVQVSKPLQVGPAQPNPMRGATSLHWSGARGGVAFEVLDVRGALIWRERLDGASGSVTWSGEQSSGRMAPAGIYFLRLSSAGVNPVVRRVVRLF